MTVPASIVQLSLSDGSKVFILLAYPEQMAQREAEHFLVRCLQPERRRGRRRERRDPFLYAYTTSMLNERRIVNAEHVVSIDHVIEETTLQDLARSHPGSVQLFEYPIA